MGYTKWRTAANPLTAAAVVAAGVAAASVGLAAAIPLAAISYRRCRWHCCWCSALRAPLAVIAVVAVIDVVTLDAATATAGDPLLVVVAAIVGVVANFIDSAAAEPMYLSR